MRDSFRKTNAKTKPDFSKKVMQEINKEEKNDFDFNPLISVSFAFIMTVLLISAIVVYMLSLD